MAVISQGEREREGDRQTDRQGQRDPLAVGHPRRVGEVSSSALTRLMHVLHPITTHNGKTSHNPRYPITDTGYSDVLAAAKASPRSEDSSFPQMGIQGSVK